MKYMVDIKLNPRSDQQYKEMTALAPMEQAHVKTLSDQGIVQTLYIGADGMRAWGIIEGVSLEDVRQKLATCSLYNHMQTEFAPLL